MTSEDYNTKILEEYKNGLATEEEMSSLLMIFAMQYHKEQLNIHNVIGRSEQLFCEYCGKENKPTCCDNCVDEMNNQI